MKIYIRMRNALRNGGQMDYTVEKLEKSQVKFNYTVDKDSFNKAIKQAYEKTKHKYAIPGFRKGHAPQKIIEGMYGAGVFFSDAVNELIDASLNELETKEEYDFVAVDSVCDVDMTEDGGVKYSIVMVVKPEVTLGQYKGLNVAKKAVKVTAKQVDEKIAQEQEKQARLVEVDTAAVNGNIVSMDFVGSVDGEKFEGGSAENYDLELGSNTFIPGFEEQLVGVKAGDVKDVKVTFPENYQAENLAGKEAVFACTVKAVKVKELPTVDDEFVKEISEFDTLAEYKADVKAQLTKEAQEKVDREFEDAVVEKIVDASQVEIPQAMIDREADEMVHEFEYRLMYQGLKLDDYLKYLNMTRDQLVDQYKDQASKSVKVRLVMEALVKAENLKIEDKEIEDKMAKFAEQSSQTVEEFKKTLHKEQVDYIVNSIMNEKLLDFLTKENLAKKTAAKKADAEAEVKDDTNAEEKKPAAKKTTKKAAKPATDAE